MKSLSIFFILSFYFPPRFRLPTLFLLHMLPHFHGYQLLVVRSSCISELASFGFETYRFGYADQGTVFVDTGYLCHFPASVEVRYFVDVVVPRLHILDEVGYGAAFVSTPASLRPFFPIEGELGIEFPELLFFHFRPVQKVGAVYGCVKGYVFQVGLVVLIVPQTRVQLRLLKQWCRVFYGFILC